MLDTASQGNFLSRDVEDGLFLVENMAMSNGTYNEDHDRTNRGSVEAEERHKKELKVLNEKLDKLLMVQHKQSIHLLEERNEEQEEEYYTEDVNYVQNQGYYKNNPNLSYRSTNVENPQDQVYPPQVNSSGQGKMYPVKPQQGYQKNQYQGNYQKNTSAPPGFEAKQVPQEPGVRQMLQQILQGQSSGTVDLNKKLAEINGRIDQSHHDLQTKIDAIAGRVQQLEYRGGASTSRPQGQLPGKAEQNPKECIHAITLHSGRDLPPRTAPTTINEDIDVQEEEISVENETPAPVVEEEPPVKPKAKAQEKPQVKKKTFVPPPFKPQLPFPSRFKKQQLEKFKALFDEQLREIEIKMPLMDAFLLIPPYQKFLKDAVTERMKELQGMVVLSQECSAIITRKVIGKKLEDPGSFTLPCSLGPLTFSRSLCDLGAGVSVMPLTVAKRLGFEKYQKCNLSLVLADHSVRLPVGMLEDLPVRVGNVEIPTDLLSLRWKKNPKIL